MMKKADIINTFANEIQISTDFVISRLAICDEEESLIRIMILIRRDIPINIFINAYQISKYKKHFLLYEDVPAKYLDYLISSTNVFKDFIYPELALCSSAETLKYMQILVDRNVPMVVFKDAYQISIHKICFASIKNLQPSYIQILIDDLRNTYNLLTHPLYGALDHIISNEIIRRGESEKSSLTQLLKSKSEESNLIPLLKDNYTTLRISEQENPIKTISQYFENFSDERIILELKSNGKH